MDNEQPRKFSRTLEAQARRNRARLDREYHIDEVMRTIRTLLYRAYRLRSDRSPTPLLRGEILAAVRGSTTPVGPIGDEDALDAIEVLVACGAIALDQDAEQRGRIVAGYVFAMTPDDDPASPAYVDPAAAATLAAAE